MAIVITLEAMLARRKMLARELAEAIGVSETHLSLFRNGNVKGVRFSTLSRLCAALDCKPGDLLDFVATDEDEQPE
jgi:putative transcriptional regulator